MSLWTFKNSPCPLIFKVHLPHLDRLMTTSRRFSKQHPSCMSVFVRNSRCYWQLLFYWGSAVKFFLLISLQIFVSRSPWLEQFRSIPLWQPELCPKHPGGHTYTWFYNPFKKQQKRNKFSVPNRSNFTYLQCHHKQSYTTLSSSISMILEWCVSV